MEQLNTTNNGKGNGKSKLFAIIIIVLLLIVAVFGVSIVYLLKTQNNKEEEKRNVLVTEDNAEEIVDELLEETEEGTTDPGYYTVTMEPLWKFSSGDAESENAVIINKDSNVTPIFVNVFMEEDESHIVYKSPVIPLGGELRNIKLDEKLDAGNYACVAEFHLLDEEQNTLSMVRVKVTIVVEN